ncbi:hypothetical protein M3Y97_00921700 [Aphelenchoides bicaudatus]|nr:hypothetical protein M3Y97_00921700 [Aphelenchoides bicaudatus]
MTMFIKWFVFFFNCIHAVDLNKNKPIEFQFYPVHPKFYGEGPHKYHMQIANISIGTPAQTLKISLQELHYSSNLRVITKAPRLSLESPGTFQTSASSTFKELGKSEQNQFGEKEGVIGTDDIQFGDHFISEKPFLVYTSDVEHWYTDLFLTRPLKDTKNHFMHSVLEDYEEKVVVLTYKNQKASKSIPGLKLTIGGRPNHLCKSDWRYLPVQDPQSFFGGSFPWLVKMESIKVGDKQINHTAPMLVNFGLTGFYGMMWHHEGKAKILKELSGGVNSKDERVSCTVNKDITFKVAGFEFRFKPKDYLWNEPRVVKNGRCLLEQHFGNDYYSIPYWFLYDKCLLLDFEKNQIVPYQPHRQHANITVGVPSQQITLELGEFRWKIEFRLPTSNASSTFYQPKKSSTFKKVDTVKTTFVKNDTVGTDVMEIGGTFLDDVPFFFDNSPATTSAQFSLNPPFDNPKHHLLTSILKNYKQKIVVITYDKPTKNYFQAPALKLTIGKRPTSLCKNDWRYLPVEEDPFAYRWKSYQTTVFPWLVKLESLKIGNHQINHTDDEPMLVNFGLTSQNNNLWHRHGKRAIIKELLGHESTDRYVPCSVKKDLVLKWFTKLPGSLFDTNHKITC